MKNIKDKKIIILGAILLVFTLIYFVAVNKVSYAFATTTNYEQAHNNRVKTIIKAAEKYGKDNIENFNEEGLLYINVQNLIDSGYLIPNEEGIIIDQMNNFESMNDKKIRLKHEDEKISAEIYS